MLYHDSHWWFATTALGMLAAIAALLVSLLVQRMLAAALARRSERRRRVLEPLVHMAMEDRREVDRGLEELRNALQPFDRALVREILLELARELRGEVVEDLRRIYAALGLLEREVDGLRAASARRRARAAENLGLLRDVSSLPALLASKDDPDAGVRAEVAEAVRGVCEASNSAALIPLLEHPDPVVAGCMQETLGNRGREVVPEIFRYVWRAPRLAGLVRAVDVLGSVRAIESVECLRALARVPDAELRASIAQALAAIGSRQCTEGLFEPPLVADAEVRRSSVRGSSDLGESTAIPELQAALQDEDWNVRKEAARILESLGESGVPSLIREASGRAPEDLVRVRGALAGSAEHALSLGGS